MPSNSPSRIQRRIEDVRNFFGRDLWTVSPQKRLHRVLVQILKTLVLTAEGLVRSDALTLAAALTFKVIFAMMPFLAVVLALLKSFGGLSTISEQFKSFIVSKMIPGEAGGYLEKIDEFLANINATAIGAVGFLLLTYTAISLLDTVERAFNRMWGIKTPRPLLRRVTIYWTMLSLAPLLLGGSLTMSAFVKSHGLYVWLSTHVPGFGAATLILTPFVMAWLLFTALYVFMPNTRVHFGAAFIGALVAGTAWELMKGVYVWYNAQVVTAHKFYGSLGAIPVFLMWVYLSWIVVLFGSEIAFAVQHVKTYKREVQEVKISPADRERLALLISLQVVKPFQAGAVPPTANDVAAQLNAPVRVVQETAYELVSKGILREAFTGDQKDAGLVPGRDPSSLTVLDVLVALRTYGDACKLPDGKEAAAVYKLIDEATGQAVKPLEKVTLKDLAASAPPA